MKPLSLVFLLLLCMPSSADWQVQLRQNNNSIGQTIYTDAEMARIVAAFQQRANIANNGTATAAQVRQHWMNVFKQQTIRSVTEFERQDAVNAIIDPAPINPQ